MLCPRPGLARRSFCLMPRIRGRSRPILWHRTLRMLWRFLASRRGSSTTPSTATRTRPLPGQTVRSRPPPWPSRVRDFLSSPSRLFRAPCWFLPARTATVLRLKKATLLPQPQSPPSPPRKSPPSPHPQSLPSSRPRKSPRPSKAAHCVTKTLQTSFRMPWQRSRRRKQAYAVRSHRVRRSRERLGRAGGLSSPSSMARNERGDLCNVFGLCLCARFCSTHPHVHVPYSTNTLPPSHPTPTLTLTLCPPSPQAGERELGGPRRPGRSTGPREEEARRRSPHRSGAGGTRAA
jgi:hypothetical protein